MTDSERILTLRMGLIEWGRHKWSCAKTMWKKNKCTCGLDALLKEVSK